MKTGDSLFQIIPIAHLQAENKFERWPKSKSKENQGEV
jgi:hypothetical protein